MQTSGREFLEAIEGQSGTRPLRDMRDEIRPCGAIVRTGEVQYELKLGVGCEIDRDTRLGREARPIARQKHHMDRPAHSRFFRGPK